MRVNVETSAKEATLLFALPWIFEDRCRLPQEINSASAIW